MSYNSAKKRSSKTVPTFPIFFNWKFLKTASFQSYCIPFFLQLRSWIEVFQFIDYLLHGWSRPRLSLHASPHQATKHTVRYKHHLFVTPLRIWKLSDAHFAKKSTKAVDINLTTIIWGSHYCLKKKCTLFECQGIKYLKCVSNFLSIWLANWQWLFNRPIMVCIKLLVRVA